MNDNQKILIVSLGLVSFGIYLLFKKTPELADVKNITNLNSVKEIGNIDMNKVLKKGSKGFEVGILQKALKNLDVDNDFGALTEARLKAVMKVNQTSLNQYNKYIK